LHVVIGRCQRLDVQDQTPVKLDPPLNVLLTVVTVAVTMVMIMAVMVMIVVVVMIVVMVVAMVVVIIIMTVMMVMMPVVFVVISVPIAPAGRIIAVIVAVTLVIPVVCRSRSRTERYSAETNYSGGSKGLCDERATEACLFRHGGRLLWMARAITLPGPSAFHFVPLAIS
jgi:hypothetical protein